MAYIDTYGPLNPHLTTEPQPHIVVGEIHMVERSPPKFLRWHEETKDTLQKIFKFSDTMFIRHMVTFPKHIVETYTNPSDQGEVRIHCYTKWGYGYYHFMTEVLPNILFLTKNNKTSTVHCPFSSFAQGVLDLFGVKNPIVFTPPPGYTSMCRQPYIECGNPSLEKIRILLDAKPHGGQRPRPRSGQEQEDGQQQQQEQDQGIIIYRKEAIRTVINHDALVSMLESVYPSIRWTTFNTASPADTAALFSRASIIVAPHGAGLTNMLYSPPGTQIYEFVPLDNPNLCYWHLAEMLGHQYNGIPCPTVDNAFHLDIDAIRLLLTPNKN